jgi:Flp pilus assembly CpaE family ATPase
VLVPDDRGACDAALLAGRALTEAAPSSPARLALAELAAVLDGRPRGQRRRGRSARLLR